ncbi:MAG: DUF4124 domain-containing protein [Gammaproteobacteria bacterium]|nr:DUF4124 domain-containing protein [Gammaproteobacteria bacterium]
MFKLILVSALFAASANAGEIYRWVDEKGQVNFSTTPPPAELKKAEAVNVNFKEQAKADGASTVTSADGRASLSSLLDPQVEWRDKCQTAVDNAHREYEIGQDTVKKNHSGGYITRDEMKQQLSALTTALRTVSIQDCVVAVDKRKAKYQCLSQFKGMQNCGFGKSA